MNILTYKASIQTVFSRMRWILGLVLAFSVAIQAADSAAPQISVIPTELRTFSAIYEWRFWYLIPLLLACGAYAFWLLYHRRKRFFAWLLAFPLFIGVLCIAATYCGWHYRMELRQRFAAYSPDSNTYSIDRMPADIRHEYAKNDYRPRFRDVKAMVLWDILSLPLLYAIGGMLWLCTGKKTGKEEVERKAYAQKEWTK